MRKLLAVTIVLLALLAGLSAEEQSKSDTAEEKIKETLNKVGKEELSFQANKDKWGVGFYGGGGFSLFVADKNNFITGYPDANLALSLHFPKTPMLLSAGFIGTPASTYGVNVNLDFFLAGKSLAPWFELHILLGGAASLYSYAGDLGLSTGVRLPLGMSFWIIDWFEVYLDLTPIVGVGFLIGPTPRVWLHLDAPISLGLRFWF